MKDHRIQLAHGGGGRLSRELIQTEIVSRFGDGPLKALPDGATLPRPNNKIIFTTDSFVVNPLEFPGGNIGDLAVHGTVNDLSVCGARPQWLSLGLILEEGLLLTMLKTILDSIKKSAQDCGVQIVTGDTKVVARGQCDGMYINTAGIGELLDGFALDPKKIVRGDKIIVSGSLGDHGMAVMSAREGLQISHPPLSDTGPVRRLVESLQPVASEIRFMRDPTRGGLATVLNEMVESTGSNIFLSESDIPFSPAAKALAEMLGLDLLHVASEGRLVAVCSNDSAGAVLAKWRALPEGKGAVCIGSVIQGDGRVVIKTNTGGTRFVDVPRGELLPRIC